MSRRGFGRRRKVLQLGDGTPKQNTYGFGYRPSPDQSKEANPIGALDMMMHYEDSDEESEEPESYRNSRDQGSSARQVQKFVASSERLEPSSQEVATTSHSSTVSNGHSVSPDTTKPKDEIDTKVMDFLAELDAFDGPDTTSADGADEIDGEPLAEASQHASTRDDEYGSMESDDNEPEPPQEPTTDWQQCLDDGTQCYYYWHCVTNQVTWEIPPEYSQYLLQYKEYEKLQAKYEEETAAYKPKPKRKRKRKKKKKNDADSSPNPTPAYGPEMPESSSQSELVVEGPSYPIPVPEVAIETSRPSIPLPSEPQQPVSSQQVIGPFLPPPPPPPAEEDSTNALAPELPSSSSNEQQKQQEESSNQDKDDDSSLGDDVDEYIHRKLEEPVFTHYEYVNKKYEGPQPQEGQPRLTSSGTSAAVAMSRYQQEEEDEDLDIDIDDIDRELEQALERKQAELQSKEVDSTPMKRPLADPTVEESLHKRQKLSDEDHVESKTNAVKSTVRQKVAALAEVTELCTQVTDKLEFLEITGSGLTRLQILMVEIQTRIEDWQEGGLSTDVFLRRLRAASQTLCQYEASAAPPGWTCHWDSKFKRYFYFNEVTEDTQWDYPLTEEYMEEDEGNHGNEATDGRRLAPAEDPTVSESTTGHMLLPPPPPPPPDAQTDKMHESTARTVQAPPPPPEPTVPQTAEHAPEPEPSSASEVASIKEDASYSGDGYSYGPMFHMPPPPPPPSGPEESEDVIGSATDDLAQKHELSTQGPQGTESEDFNEQDVQDDTISPATEHIEHDAQSLPHTAAFDKPSHIHAEPVLSAKPNGSAEENITAMDTSEATGVPIDQQTKEPGPSSSQMSTDSISQVHSPSIATSTEGSSSQETTATGTSTKNQATPSVKEKKKKKDKSLVGGGLSMKKKNVTGLVQKWQKVQKEVEKEMAHQKKIAKIAQEEDS